MCYTLHASIYGNDVEYTGDCFLFNFIKKKTVDMFLLAASVIFIQSINYICSFLKNTAHEIIE